MQNLSELEGCTLASVWRIQPCSTYEIRRAFAESPTPEWSASAGAIYPVIAKLVRNGLVRARTMKGDARGRRNLELSAKGLKALSDWTAKLEDWMGGTTPNPIRTRLLFLDALTASRDRRAFFKRAKNLTREAIANLSAYRESLRDMKTPDYLAGLGALYELEARLKWLEAVEAELVAT